MANVVMTNTGLQSKRGGQPGSLNDPSSPLRSSGSFSLPPLNPDAYAAVEALESANDEIAAGVSPARRSRRHGLIPGSDPHTKTGVQAAVNMGQLEQEMAFARENHRDNGRQLLELWVNQVLDPGGMDMTGRTEPLKMDASVLKGLTQFGLTRVELRGTGLSDALIDRLYRGLYVYTVGFFDIMQDILKHSEFRVEVLGNVWRAFLKIAESALKVAFKSDYLQLFQAQQVTAAELLIAKEALAEARADGYNTEKALAWLTAAHAEERAMRAGMKQQLANALAQMELEQRAHQAAVEKYVNEVEARGRALVELQEKDDKLVQAALSHAEVIAQRDQLLSEKLATEQMAADLVNQTADVTRALAMDDDLSCPPELREDVDKSETTIEVALAKAQALKVMTEGLYIKYQAQKAEFASQTREFFATKDALRDTSERLTDTKHELDIAEDKGRALDYQLELSNERNSELQAEIDALRRQLSSEAGSRAAAEDVCLQQSQRIELLESALADTSSERDEIRLTSERQRAQLDRQEEVMNVTDVELSAARSVGAECSKALSITMAALQANQIARALLQRLLQELRTQSSRSSRQLQEAKRHIRVLEGESEELHLTIANTQQQLSNVTREARNATAVATELQHVVADKDKQLLSKSEKISLLETKLSQTADELSKRTAKLAATEESLATEKEEVMRLFESFQAFEGQVKGGAEERMDLVRRIDHLRAEMNLMEERAARKEDAVQMEIKHLQSQVELESSRCVGLDLQLEAQRSRLDETSDALTRKRDKKRRWKRLHVDAEAQVEHLTKLLNHRNQVIVVLEERMQRLDVDVAILVADRGRSLLAPGDARDDHLSEELQDDGNYGFIRPPPTPELPQHLLDAVSEHSAHVSPTLGLGGPSGEVAAPLHDGRAAGEDIVVQYRQWDGLSARALQLQMMVDKENTKLEEARNAYEKARAVFYTNPSEPELRRRMEASEAEATNARRVRAEVEAQLDEVNEYMRQLQAKLRHHEQNLARRRLREMERRAGTRDASLRSEMSERVEEANRRAGALQELLAQQKVAADMVAAAKSNVEGELLNREAELRLLGDQIHQVTAEKLRLEAELSNAKQAFDGQSQDITHLQAAEATLTEQLSKATASIALKEKDMERLQRKTENAMRRLKDEFSEREQGLNRAMADAEVAAAAEYAALQARHDDVAADRDAAVGHAKDLVVSQMHAVERSDPPDFLRHFTTSCDAQLAVQRACAYLPAGCLPDRLSNFGVDEEVVEFIQPTFETVLVLISQVYSDKLARDLKEEEFLLGGLVGRRTPLPQVLYDFFITRFGMRDTAELHLAAFLRAVRNMRTQHPKVRMFARLLDLDDSIGGLPRTAADFYVAMLNRVHSRAGPLMSEAAEGVSLAKCRLLAKSAREFMRGSLTHLCEDAGNITQALQSLALNDEEKAIDVETSLEMVFKAWVKQYKLDLRAAAEVFTKTCKSPQGRPSVTPDEFLAFLDALDATKAASLERQQAMTMYRQALRAAGPCPADSLATIFASTVLDAGFVGPSTHLSSRLEPIKSFPPYDEFRILIEMWKSIRPVVEAQMVALEENKTELSADTASYLNLYQELEQELESSRSSDAAWATLRRLLGTYCAHRRAVDALHPFKAHQAAALAAACFEGVSFKTRVSEAGARVPVEDVAELSLTPDPSKTAPRPSVRMVVPKRIGRSPTRHASEITAEVSAMILGTDSARTTPELGTRTPTPSK
uniref:Flagellar associated protein n=1 Tax=Chlamydomonas euryale TaxID=1486919 RepID=A0A7R9YWS5_9CHLO|mmetsp:Transcript_29840/g.88355  ORF Transcript_29840/g.88355 Transcript_29840/m.88355 type:complete len:1730 (+) Transcript_29840:262-5451(+)